MKKYGRKILNSTIALYVSIALTVLIVFFSFYYAYGRYTTTLIADKQEKALAYASSNKLEEDGGIVFYGDSITEMCETSRYYPEFKIINRGISGDTTNGMLQRLDSNLLNIKPSTVLFLGGINDIDKHISKNEIVDNIDKIVTAIKGVNPDCRIIVQSIYPVNENIRPRYLNKVHNRNNQAVREVNVELEKICQNRGCVYVDVYSLLADEEGNLNKLYTRDGLHLIKKGYFAVAEIIKPYLAESE